MGRPRGTYGARRGVGGGGKLKERNRMEDLSIWGTIILKWIFEKYGGRCGVDSSGWGLAKRDGVYRLWVLCCMEVVFWGPCLWLGEAVWRRMTGLVNRRGMEGGGHDCVWCWIKIDQLDVTCFIISLFTAQHVSDVSTSIFRSLRLICWVISCVVLPWFDVCWCYGVVRLGWCGVVSGCRLKPQHVSDVNTSILRSLRLICWVI